MKTGDKKADARHTDAAFLLRQTGSLSPRERAGVRGRARWTRYHEESRGIDGGQRPEITKARNDESPKKCYHSRVPRLSAFGNRGVSIHRAELAKIRPSPQPSPKGEGASNIRGAPLHTDQCLASISSAKLLAIAQQIPRPIEPAVFISPGWRVARPGANGLVKRSAPLSRPR
jgi:hypothetical protein